MTDSSYTEKLSSLLPEDGLLLEGVSPDILVDPSHSIVDQQHDNLRTVEQIIRLAKAVTANGAYATGIDVVATWHGSCGDELFPTSMYIEHAVDSAEESVRIHKTSEGLIRNSELRIEAVKRDAGLVDLVGSVTIDHLMTGKRKRSLSTGEIRARAAKIFWAARG